jgi:hypothetical protein
MAVSDDFNRGVGDVGTNWTSQTGGLAVNATAKCQGTSAGNYNQSFYNAAAFADNQYSQAVASSGATGYGGVQVRASGTGASRNGYYVLYGASGSRISKVVNGTITDLVSAGGIADPATNDVVKITALDATITVFYNGVQQGSSQTDSTLTSGSPGIITFDGGAELDDWEGGDVTPPVGGIVFNMQIG